MAKTRKNKTTPESDEPSFFKGSKTQYKQITGLILILTALLFFLAFLSYLFTGQVDEATVASLQIDDFNREAMKHSYANALGKFGYFISSLFVKKSFGLSAFLLCLLLFHLLNVGLCLMVDVLVLSSRRYLIRILQYV